jgi:hypothetical protein
LKKKVKLLHLDGVEEKVERYIKRKTGLNILWEKIISTLKDLDHYGLGGHSILMGKMKNHMKS